MPGGLGLSSALSGLSATYPGMQQGMSNEYKLDDQKRASLAKVAMGNALQLLAGGGQGNQPGIPDGQPQPPMPGMASQPMQQPGQPSPPPAPPQGAGGPMPQGGAPGGMPPPPQGMMLRPPMGGPAPGGMPGQPQGGMQPPQQMGRQNLDWRQLVQAVSQSNPNLPPDVMAEAVNQFLPMMSQQSQQEWRQVSLQIREQQLQEKERQFLMAEQGRNTRADQATTSRENIATTQADSRESVASGNRDSREDIANRNEEGRNTRSAAGRDQRQQQFETREARLGESLKLREDSTWARLEQQKEQALQKAQAAGGKQGLAQVRAVIDAQDKHIRTRIQAYSVNNSLKPAERKALLDQADMEYNDQIGKLRQQFGASTPSGGTTATPEPKVQGQVPPGQPGPTAQPFTPGGGQPPAAAPGTPAPAGERPPPEAIQALKEGQVTTFENGQKWTLKNGQPERVP